jgi:hypothetical protein
LNIKDPVGLRSIAEIAERNLDEEANEMTWKKKTMVKLL